MGFENVGKIWTPASLEEYLESRTPPAWATSITMHHTASPSLADRPNGLKIQHIRNIQSYYEEKLGWKSGPHLFIDEDEVFGMCDFKAKGVHAKSFNATSIGIEVLGYYDTKKEDPKSGRGLRCWTNAAATARVLLDWLGLKKGNKTVLFHRDDPKTTKTCPGSAVTKDWFLSLIPSTVSEPVNTPQEPAKPDVGVPWKDWHFVGERWCVPILTFLGAKGIPSAEVIGKLKSIDGKLHYDGELIEGAFYVAKGKSPKPDSCSWAPARELLEIAKV
jgi:hypothetical protein